MTALQTGPDVFQFMNQAHKMIMDNKADLGVGHAASKMTPEERQAARDRLASGETPAYRPRFSHGTGFEYKLLKDIYDPKNFHQILGGRTLGRLYTEAIGKRLHLDSVSAKAQADVS